MGMGMGIRMTASIGIREMRSESLFLLGHRKKAGRNGRSVIPKRGCDKGRKLLAGIKRCRCWYVLEHMLYMTGKSLLSEVMFCYFESYDDWKVVDF